MAITAASAITKAITTNAATTAAKTAVVTVNTATATTAKTTTVAASACAPTTPAKEKVRQYVEFEVVYSGSKKYLVFSSFKPIGKTSIDENEFRRNLADVYSDQCSITRGNRPHSEAELKMINRMGGIKSVASWGFNCISIEDLSLMLKVQQIESEKGAECILLDELSKYMLADSLM
jgi:hypothetical protein